MTARRSPPREVTVLHANLRGFVAFAEERPLEESAAALDAYFDALIPPIRDHGGSVDRLAGDRLIAVFGAPVPLPRSATAAARCALEMMDRGRRLPLMLSIGLDTGLVVAGIVGSADVVVYSVVGDVGHVAERMCVAAAPGEILASERTVAGLGGSVAVVPRPAVLVRGRRGSLGAAMLEVSGTSRRSSDT